MPDTDLGQQLKNQTAGVRLSRSRFGTSKTLTHQQTEKAASNFAADAERVSARKKLIDTRAQAYREVTAIMSRAKEIWVDMTTPYPENGVRLIRKGKISELVERIVALNVELGIKTAALDLAYADLKQESRAKLGELFNEGDYPSSIGGAFSFELDFPSIAPPEYLQQLNPELYQQQVERIQARFDEAVQLAQDAFTSEFASLLANLTERLAPGKDGKSKTFKASTVENLKEFFGRFQELNVGGNEALEAMIAKAKEIVGATDAEGLRKDVFLREQIREKLAAVAVELDPLIVNKPKRMFQFEESESPASEPAAEQAETAVA